MKPVKVLCCMFLFSVLALTVHKNTLQSNQVKRTPQDCINELVI